MPNEYEPLRSVYESDLEVKADDEFILSSSSSTTGGARRVASLDVFRGLCVFLMMLVDYVGSIFPIIAHSPWNGVHLADFVMPFFLLAAGFSLALVYKKVENRADATRKALLRALKLFFLGVLLQGGYLHGITSLTYGVDIEKIRWMGILQRISIGYIFAALCEIWIPMPYQYQYLRRVIPSRKYFWHCCIACSLMILYMGLSYGVYVPDWKFELQSSGTSSTNDTSVYLVKCSTRGDLGPGCNSAGMIDRHVLGLKHLYTKPVYKNLMECNASRHGIRPDLSPPWCHAPFDPEGILSSLTAAVACIIGLFYGHKLVDYQEHKERLCYWSIYSVSFLVLGLLLTLLGIPINKSLYTISYMLVTSATAGITFSLLYILIDVFGYRYIMYPLEWMGKHSLGIFILITSNLVVIAIQGFYWKAPENNIVHWIVTRFKDS